MKKQPIKLKVRRNPRTGDYASRVPVEPEWAVLSAYVVKVTETRVWGHPDTVDKTEFASWPSVPWEEVPLRVRAQFRKMLREDNDV